jgi:hypothetical protein
LCTVRKNNALTFFSTNNNEIDDHHVNKIVVLTFSTRIHHRLGINCFPVADYHIIPYWKPQIIAQAKQSSSEVCFATVVGGGARRYKAS